LKHDLFTVPVNANEGMRIMLSFWMALARDIAVNARPVFATNTASPWNAAPDVRRAEFRRKPVVNEGALFCTRDYPHAVAR
jgi:hypothetical protein